ncbi:hypothetical protein ACROYT_G004076 [Oculina patagonica]
MDPSTIFRTHQGYTSLQRKKTQGIGSQQQRRNSSMAPLLVFLFTFVQAVLISGPHSVKADFSDSCVGVNSTNSTSCIHTYEQLYNSLTKSENSFNIESALYPAKRPSSVRVFVNVYGPNKTKNSKPVAKYTWSISCLYVALPPLVLEILSLGSILVHPRTQNLSIQIPLFCCNVSDNDDERSTHIKEMIEGVLAALQDLAVSPGIRDPKLNTAECVIEGHDTDIDATGRNLHIRFILWSSFLFVFVSCNLLSSFLEEYRKLAWSTEETDGNANGTNTERTPMVTGQVMAGQSYNGRETADETVKTALLSVIGLLVSWVSWKRKSSNKSANKAVKTTNGQPEGTADTGL